ncbi:MAG: FprA family A-type flavoprotein [bacterium]
MKAEFQARKVAENVYWVGGVDWELADFHGYATPQGTTYNAFLVLDEKNVLIDTVKAPFYDEMMSRIRSVIDPGEIDIIVSNHSEMDHSGALISTYREIQPEAVYASAKGVDALKRHLNPDFELQAVVEGQQLSIGQATLTFIMSTMVHWPDSMFTYFDLEGGILFSNDAFGMHVASTERWADELDPALIRLETAKYYANILWPTSKAVQGVMKKLRGFGRPIGIIAPDHGPLWRRDLDTVLDWYDRWASGTPHGKKAVVLFDTMWGSTAKMGRAIAEGLGQAGMSVKVLPLSKSHRTDVATELLEASAFIVGSPSLNGGIFPTIADALTYVKGLRPSKPTIPGVAFGSFGWSPAVHKKLAEELETMGIELFEDPLKVQYVPGPDDLEACAELGRRIAEKVLAGPTEQPSEEPQG